MNTLQQNRQTPNVLWRTLYLAIALVPLAVSNNAQFSTPQRLDTNTTPGQSESDGIAVTSAGDTVHVAWFEQNATTGRDVYYTRSLDGGATWGTPQRIDQATGNNAQEFPVIMAEGQTVVLAWLDDRGAPLIQDVYARVSQDGGTSFGAEIAATGSLTGDGGDADNLVGAISLPYVYLCFEDDSKAKDPSGLFEDTIVVSSSNSGASFGAPQVVNRPPGGVGSADVDNPAIAASGATVNVAWVDGRNGVADKVYANRSTDGGLTFGLTDVRLDSALASSADANNPRMEASGSDVIVTWRDNRVNPLANAKKLYLNASVDGGASYLGDVRVDAATTAANTQSGKIAFSGDDFVIGWVDDRNDPLLISDDVFVRTGSLAGGALALGIEQRLDQTTAGNSDSGGIKVAYKNNSIYVLYQDSRNDPSNINDSLYLRASSDGGQTFQPELGLTPSLGATKDAESNEFVVTSSYDVVAVWADNRNGTGTLPPNDVFGATDQLFPGTVTNRNAGTNPQSYVAPVSVIGQAGTATVDLSLTGHALAGLIGYGSPLTFPLGGGQTILVNITDPGGELLGLSLAPGPSASFVLSIPNDISLVGFLLSTQGLHFGGVQPFALSNAQDIVIGTF